jgi:PAS domain S-box-containing protein
VSEPGDTEQRLRESERQLRETQRLALLGSWEWDVAANRVSWSEELYRIYGLTPAEFPATFEGFLERVHPEDRERARRIVEASLLDQRPFEYDHRIVRTDGTVRTMHARGQVFTDGQGRVVRMLGTAQDVTERRRVEEALRESITERKRAEALVAGENRVLEMVATGRPLAETLEAIARLVEEQAEGMLCSILLLDETGTRLRHGAAPSLPASYNQAVDGIEIGPSAGCCGTAAYRRQRVVAPDIMLDPLCAGFRERASAHGLRACWSTPILPPGGDVLGTLAMYYHEPRSPSGEELRVIDVVAHLASIAIEESRAEESLRRSAEQLRDLAARLQQAREEERAQIAREIHDELGQTLTALKMDVAWVRQQAGSGISAELRERLRAMSDLADGTIQAVRRIATELRPSLLDDLGLAAAVEWQAREFEKRTGIACTLHSTLKDRGIRREVATAAFRILQEALTNVARHSGAGHVAVRLGRYKDGIVLEVSDDGRGLPVEASQSGSSLGLVGMHERAFALGGEVRVDGAPGQGTTVWARIPLRAHGRSGERERAETRAARPRLGR